MSSKNYFGTSLLSEDPHKIYANDWTEGIQKIHSEFDQKAELHGQFEVRSVARNLCISYAQMALRNLVLINGGALISLPILERLGFSTGDILLSGSLFVGGLVFSMLAITMAFFCSARFTEYACCDIRASYYQHMSSAHNMRNEPKISQAYKDLLNEDEFNKSYKGSYKVGALLEKIAIGLALSSLACFCLGALLPQYIEYAEHRKEIVMAEQEKEAVNVKLLLEKAHAQSVTKEGDK